MATWALTCPAARPSTSSDVRQFLDRILAAALAAVEPGQAVRNFVSLDLGVLRVAERAYPLSQFRRALIVGAGKASAPMAAAFEGIIGDRLPIEVTVSFRYGHGAAARSVKIREAGHPIPDQASVEATREISQLLEGADERDLVLCVISGGGSALLTLPTVSLHDLQKTTDALLRCGANINEINTVRKHIDQVKGGGLAKLAAPAQLVTLVLSDVVGNPRDAIASGPTVPDTSTWADARDVFDRYGLWDQVPESVTRHFRQGGTDTPKPGDP